MIAAYDLARDIIRMIELNQGKTSTGEGSSLMNTTGIFIPLLIICLLFSSFHGQIMQTVVNFHLQFNQTEMTDLEALRTAPSHQGIWNNIRSRVMPISMAHLLQNLIETPNACGLTQLMA